jgi:hypothetical protein
LIDNLMDNLDIDTALSSPLVALAEFSKRGIGLRLLRDEVLLDRAHVGHRGNSFAKRRKLILEGERKRRRLLLNSHCRVVDVLKVPSQVATLSEVLPAEATLEGSLASVLSEVVPEVARFLKDTPAVRILAFEEQLGPLGLWVPNFNGTMPLTWDSFKCLGDSLNFLRACMAMISTNWAVIWHIVFVNRALRLLRLQSPLEASFAIGCEYWLFECLAF